MSAIIQPIKWHGGKHYLAKKIIDLMPPRCKAPNKPALDDKGWLHYVEPYFGGGAVLLANDPEGISEVVNDKNLALVNFWKAIRDGDKFGEFCRAIQATPFAETEWEDAGGHPQCSLDVPDSKIVCLRCALRFFVRCRQSLAGRMTSFTGITKTRTRRGMNNEVSAWLTCVEGLSQVHERLKRVLILERDALRVIRSQDGPQTLFYLDPPYLHETRATTGEYGEYEMTEAQHGELINILSVIKGRFLLSGYRSGMYDRAAAQFGWRRACFDIPNAAAGGKTKRRMTECVWTNY